MMEMQTVERLEWRPIYGERQPDDEITVLLFSDEKGAWPGYCDSGRWYWADGSPALDLSYWAEMPSGPQPVGERFCLACLGRGVVPGVYEMQPCGLCVDGRIAAEPQR
jgi:hypothetical protein